MIKKRLTVNLPEQDYEILSRLSDLNGSSMSSIVAELVGVVTPILAQMVVNFETVSRASDKLKEQLRASTESAYEEIMALQERAVAAHAAYSADFAKQIDFLVEQDRKKESVEATKTVPAGNVIGASTLSDFGGAETSKSGGVPPYNNMGVRSWKRRGVKS